MNEELVLQNALAHLNEVLTSMAAIALDTDNRNHDALTRLQAAQFVLDVVAHLGYEAEG